MGPCFPPLCGANALILPLQEGEKQLHRTGVQLTTKKPPNWGLLQIQQQDFYLFPWVEDVGKLFKFTFPPANVQIDR